MQLEEIKKLALKIRVKYEEYEKQRNGKPWTNEQIIEGFIVDVGDLTRLIMAKEGIRDGENVDEGLAHELSDCLWCVLVLADKYGIDLEKVFVENMNELHKKLELQ